MESTGSQAGLKSTAVSPHVTLEEDTKVYRPEGSAVAATGKRTQSRFEQEDLGIPPQTGRAKWLVFSVPKRHSFNLEQSGRDPLRASILL